MRASRRYEFPGRTLSHDVRPGATYGATITPVQNAYGAYASVFAAIPFDAWAIEVTVQGIQASTVASDSLTTLAIDPAGGSTFTDANIIIPDLLTGYAGGFGGASALGVSYWFPLFIRAGVSIGAKGATIKATVGTQKVSVKLWGQPSDPRAAPRPGSFVRAFGVNTPSSPGTAVTAGTASEGAYAQLGTISDDLLWYWNLGITPAAAATVNAGQLVSDLALGTAGAKKFAILNQLTNHDAAENLYAVFRGDYALGVNGDGVYTRAQCANADTAFAAVAYGVGG